jgi:Mg-chelatase subunit ChlD
MLLRRRYAGHGLTMYPPGRYFDQLSDLHAGKLVMVMDVSGSMAGLRLSGAVAGARDLLGAALAKSYVVGVVSFSTSATVPQPLTIDLQAIEPALTALTAGGGTDMSEGIRRAHQLLRELRGERVMAIFSDGQTDRGSAIAAAMAARRDGIRIIAALGGTADPGFMRDVVGEDEDVDLEVAVDSQIRERVAGLASLIRPTWR